MHEFFAGSGLVAYGLKGMFMPVWANDISEQKAAVYEANFGFERFILDDIKNIKGRDLPFAHLSWASFPLSGFISGRFHWRNPRVAQRVGLGMASCTRRDG